MVTIRRILNFFILPLGFLILSSLTGAFQLKRADVRMTMEEMFAYHVEYKEFSPLLARRALKIYIEQFDPDKVYLLASEVKPFIEPEQTRLSSVVQKYYRDELSEFDAINQVVQRSITRARGYRQEIEKELLSSSKEEVPLVLVEPYLDYSSNEKELKSRIRDQLLRILAIEKRLNTGSNWGAEQRKKAFALWERRFTRIENTYFNSHEGKTLLSFPNEHFLCLHTLKALAKSLDAHSSYFSPEEAFEMRTSLEKQFEGIGVILREGIDGVVIHDMVKGGPAERSGKIAAGDVLVEVDGRSVEGAPYEEVLNRLQGKGKIQLGLRHYQSDKQNFYRVDLKREKIVMQDERVQFSYEQFGPGIIGKLNLPSFYESGEGSSCEMDLREALRGLKKQGDLVGLVLDMRENSGGFLNQAVKVAGLFITSGVVVISKYAHGEMQYLRDLDGRSYYNGPLVILTSKASASAAEIVAQALQDYGIGVVVGDERTYGKGTIQYQTVTDSSARSFFKVTVGRYYTVSGRSTQIEGVKADIVVPTVYSALNIGERYLEYPLKNDRVPSAYTDPLTDVDQRNRAWFQKNYLPTLQKKLSVWTQMMPELKANSAQRLKQNKDYNLFLKALEQEKNGKSFSPSAQENWGTEDLQMIEAINIVKDMATLKPAATKKAAAALH
jgi:carboxyl-terminal processing protease